MLLRTFEPYAAICACCMDANKTFRYVYCWGLARARLALRALAGVVTPQRAGLQRELPGRAGTWRHAPPAERHCLLDRLASARPSLLPEPPEVLQAYSAVLAAEREGLRHERQLAAEGAARNELAESLGQSERSAHELGELLTQQHAVQTLPCPMQGPCRSASWCCKPCRARSARRRSCKGSACMGEL